MQMESMIFTKRDIFLGNTKFVYEELPLSSLCKILLECKLDGVLHCIADCGIRMNCQRSNKSL